MHPRKKLKKVESGPVLLLQKQKNRIGKKNVKFWIFQLINFRVVFGTKDHILVMFKIIIVI